MLEDFCSPGYFFMTLEYCEKGELLTHVTKEHQSYYKEWWEKRQTVRKEFPKYTMRMAQLDLEDQKETNPEKKQVIRKEIQRLDEERKECFHSAFPEQIPMKSNNEYTTRVQKLFQQMVLTLNKFHGHGILHLDVSMENALLDDNGNVKICDFGRVKDFSTRPKVRKLNKVSEETFVGWDFSYDTWGGKTKYMSPEAYAYVDAHNNGTTQVTVDPNLPRAKKREAELKKWLTLSPKPYDGQLGEIWSLGCCLFMMLVSSSPFQEPHPRDDKYRKLMDPSRGVAFVLGSEKRLSFVPEDALDLLHRIFQLEGQRITMPELLRHPYMAQRLDTKIEVKEPVRVTPPPSPRMMSTPTPQAVAGAPLQLRPNPLIIPQSPGGVTQGRLSTLKVTPPSTVPSWPVQFDMRSFPGMAGTPNISFLSPASTATPTPGAAEKTWGYIPIAPSTSNASVAGGMPGTPVFSTPSVSGSAQGIGGSTAAILGMNVSGGRTPMGQAGAMSFLPPQKPQQFMPPPQQPKMQIKTAPSQRPQRQYLNPLDRQMIQQFALLKNQQEAQNSARHYPGTTPYASRENSPIPPSPNAGELKLPLAVNSRTS